MLARQYAAPLPPDITAWCQPPASFESSEKQRPSALKADAKRRLHDQVVYGGGMTTRTHADEIVASWVGNAMAWTKAVRENKIKSRVAGTNEAIIKALASELSCRVLDVGCGEGWLAHELSGRGYDVVGIDASIELLARAREGAGHYLHMSYEELYSKPLLPEGVFDRVVCNFSLFEEELTPLLRALSKKLVPQGILVIQTVHPGDACSGWRFEDFCSVEGDFSSAMPYYLRSLEDWQTQLNRGGFDMFRFEEPLNPDTRSPLSLILFASLPKR